MLHDETDCRAMRAAAEAMVELLGLADGKRGGFFVWNGQQATKFAPAFLSGT